MYSKSGSATDGLVYVDGVRGVLSLTSGGLGVLPLNQTQVDYVPSAGTISVGVALASAIDSGFVPPGVSGNKWALEYILPTVSAGKFGIVIRDGWTVT
jgi:hypothetical protein